MLLRVRDLPDRVEEEEGRAVQEEEGEESIEKGAQGAY